MHTELGERKKENQDVLTAIEKEDLRSFVDIANSDTGVLPEVDKQKSNGQTKVKKTAIAENKESKRQAILNTGLESNFQKGILGFEKISVDKITIHKGIINEDIQRKKVESIQSSLLTTFDPKLAVIYVAPVLKSGEKYFPTVDSKYKALDGRHLISAIKNIYDSGKILRGLENGKIMWPCSYPPRATMGIVALCPMAIVAQGRRPRATIAIGGTNMAIRLTSN